MRLKNLLLQIEDGISSVLKKRNSAESSMEVEESLVSSMETEEDNRKTLRAEVFDDLDQVIDPNL